LHLLNTDFTTTGNNLLGPGTWVPGSASRERTMPAATTHSHNEHFRVGRSRFYGTTGLMGISAALLCASVIVYSNSVVSTEGLTDVYSSLELAVVMLIPYMISAAVAAITALGILALVPLIRMQGPVLDIRERLHQLACGDLSSTIPVSRKHSQLRELIGELNHSVSVLGDQISQWKLTNRQQWDILQGMHEAAASSDYEMVKRHIDKMEENWRKIAEIEQQLVT